MGAIKRVFQQVEAAVGGVFGPVGKVVIRGSTLGLSKADKKKKSSGGGPGLPAPTAVPVELPDGPKGPEEVTLPKVTATKTTGRKRRQNIKTTPLGLTNTGLLSAKKKLLGQ